MNVPIHLFDIKPNARFPVGSEVTFVDDKWLKIRGTVLGHAAEDRLWVQMPNSIEQLDVEDVVGFTEIREGMGQKPVDPIVASRGSRRSSLITFDDLEKYMPEDEGEEGLEYIPDQPDFLDGDPVAPEGIYTGDDTFTGELPSEQDPRDKIDDDEGLGDCPSFDLVVEIPEIGDMTDMIEGLIASRRKEALGWGRSKSQPKQKQPPVLKNLMRFKDPQGNKLYGNEKEAALNYNIFDDPGMQQFLIDYGLNRTDIQTFSKVRAHQLEKAKQKVGEGDYKWGQGTGVQFKKPAPSGAPQKKSGQPGQAPQTLQAPQKIKLSHPPGLNPAQKQFIQTKVIPAMQRGKPIVGVPEKLLDWYRQQLTNAGQKIPGAKPKAQPAQQAAPQPVQQPAPQQPQWGKMQQYVQQSRRRNPGDGRIHFGKRQAQKPKGTPRERLKQLARKRRQDEKAKQQEQKVREQQQQAQVQRQSRSPVLQGLMQQKDSNGNPVYKNEKEAALGYNLFDDPNVRQVLQQYGLTMQEISTFGDIREHQLQQARQKFTTGYTWGQGTGAKYNVRSPAQAGPAQQAAPAPQPPPAPPAPGGGIHPGGELPPPESLSPEERADLVEGYNQSPGRPDYDPTTGPPEPKQYEVPVGASPDQYDPWKAKLDAMYDADLARYTDFRRGTQGGYEYKPQEDPTHPYYQPATT